MVEPSRAARLQARRWRQHVLAATAVTLALLGSQALAGGPDLVVRTVQQDFGIPIHHYLLVNFDGFRDIVNALGGIRMAFPYPARDSLSGLHVAQPGCRHLNGHQALAVARSRHYHYLRDGRWTYDPASDLSRIKRQHAFF